MSDEADPGAGPVEPGPVPRRPQPPPRQARPSPVGWIILLGMMIAGISISFAMCGLPVGRGERVIGSGEDRVGVVEMTGAITDTTEVVRQVREMARRDDLLALVVRVDSPGGAVAPSQELFDAIRDASKKRPVVASIGNMAASGGLWVAVAADRIFASPGSVTGSIGVISQTPDLRALAETLKIDVRTFKSGPLKDVGSPLRELTADDEQMFMDLISDIYDQFVDTVATRRGLDRAAVLAFADGRVFTGRAAKDVGLVDELGGLFEAAARAVVLGRERGAAREGRELTDEEKDPTQVDPVLVYPKEAPPSLLELLTRGVGESIYEGVADSLYRPRAGVELR